VTGRWFSLGAPVSYKVKHPFGEKENRRNNKVWTIQRNRQQWAYKIQDEVNKH
jgi:hypothetical protein